MTHPQPGAFIVEVLLWFMHIIVRQCHRSLQSQSAPIRVHPADGEVRISQPGPSGFTSSCVRPPQVMHVGQGHPVAMVTMRSLPHCRQGMGKEFRNRSGPRALPWMPDA